MQHRPKNETTFSNMQNPNLAGMIAAFMAVNTYLIDAFTLYAASAIAANTILRSVRKDRASF